MSIFRERMDSLHPSNSCEIQIMTFDPTMSGDDQSQPMPSDDQSAAPMPEEQKEEVAGEEPAA